MIKMGYKKVRNKKRGREAGFLLWDALCAFMVLSIGIGGLDPLVTSTLNQMSQAREKDALLMYTRSTLESVKSQCLEQLNTTGHIEVNGLREPTFLRKKENQVITISVEPKTVDGTVVNKVEVQGSARKNQVTLSTYVWQTV